MRLAVRSREALDQTVRRTIVEYAAISALGMEIKIELRLSIESKRRDLDVPDSG